MIEPIYDNATLTLENIERQVIVARLAHFGGDKILTAKSLGVTERTIYNKLDLYAKEKEIADLLAKNKATSDAEWLAKQRGNVKTMEQLTPADFQANPLETYAPMHNPKPATSEMPVSAQQQIQQAQPVVAPAARLAPVNTPPKRRNA